MNDKVVETIVRVVEMVSLRVEKNKDEILKRIGTRLG